MEMGEGLTRQQMDQLQEVFHLFDRNGDGCITLDELRTEIQKFDYNLTEEELKDMINEVDADGNGTIEFGELRNLMSKTFKEETEEKLEEAFKLFDENQDGYISANELSSVLRMLNLGERITYEEIQQMINDADLDGDGHVDYHEFVNMMTEYWKKADDESEMLPETSFV